MRFESVTAHEFGPFRDERLEFGPGMNVVHGRNEAGKSSWHAALYAGLCGVRRGRGVRGPEKAFAARHKPWGRDEWRVGAVIRLEDGRCVELRHDLAGKVDSSAQDTSVAKRDYANEIIYDGAPDGSRWLGLNRRSFLSTACVRQADILKVRNNPESLQEDMQRAAATAGADATAAAALQRLDDYLRERVGSTRAPTKPLVRTERETAAAREALAAAQEAHGDYLRQRAGVECLERAARDARLRVDAIHAVLAEAKANEFAGRLRQARALNEQFPGGAPHPLSDSAELERKVTEALTTWRNLPALQELTGPSARQLAERIDEGHRELLAARAVVAETVAAEAEHRVARARELETLFPGGSPRVSPEEERRVTQIREALAAWDSLGALDKPAGPSAEEIERKLESFDEPRPAAPAASGPSGPPWLVAVSVICVLGGVAGALWLPGFLLDGLVLGLVGTAIGGLWFAWSRFAGPRPPDPSLARVIDNQRDALARDLAARREQERRHENQIRQRDGAISRLRDLAADLAAEMGAEAGALAEPETLAQGLREWAREWRQAKKEAAELVPRWDELQGLLGGSPLDQLGAGAGGLRREADGLIAPADETLLAELRARGITGSELAEIERRTDEQRRAWQEERAARSAAEARHRRDSERIAAAGERLRETAARLGATDDEADNLASWLEEWRARRERVLAEAGQRGESWDQLQQMLGQHTLDELAEEEARHRARADRLAEVAGADALAEAREERPADKTMEAVQPEAESARAEALRARGRLTERERNLPRVADAEDALAAAEREQARIMRLKRTLDSTIDFLEQAQERVLRDVAPILAGTVREWLPRVTHGRYTECRIDPESLLVEVRATGGRWRSAELLSHGTAEQIYLLLRFALSRHLTREGETCPLILDDVVGASDTERKRAVLNTLRSLGESTQVILFTHEDDVREWARRNLKEPGHRLIEIAEPRLETDGRPAT